MRLRVFAGVTACFVLIGVLLVVILAGPDSLLAQTRIPNLWSSQAKAVPAGNVIMRENTYPGTSSWKIRGGKDASTQIQAYAGATSVAAGQSLTFYVSTQSEGTSYSIAIYRLGWYEGLGGRLMLWLGGLTGHAQGYYDIVHHRLVNCKSCQIDVKTGHVEANWQPSYSVTVPSDWTTGIYLAKFADAQGMQTYAPFDVLGNGNSTYVVVTPDTTNAAYNQWGGYSLYDADRPVHVNENTSFLRAVKVSFDRPYVDQIGSSEVLDFDADAIHWMERQGYDLSYISDVDLHKDPVQLLHHRAYLSLGHDEYWTKEMRDGVEHARDKGVGLAFLGANAAYWQMRFESNRAGMPYRTIVCYKVETVLHDLELDPLYGIDNSRVTTKWRDPVIARPENALVGVMFSNLSHTSYFPWQLNSQAHSQLLAGTSLSPGQQYGCEIVGYEWDHVFSNGSSPVGLQVIGTSHTIDIDKNPDTSDTTYYIASSGAMVFATGSIYWTFALDNYRLHASGSCSSQNLVVPGIQKLMANVMAALIVHHSSL